MQVTHLPMCRFLSYIIDILVYLYNTCKLITVSISVSINNVFNIAFGGERETLLPISHYVVTVLRPT